MKILKTSVLSAVLSVCFLHAPAQQSRTVPINEPDYSKPNLFNDLPRRMKLQTTALENLFALPVGSFIKTAIASDFIFQGTIVSKAAEAGVQSVIVKSTNRAGATLTFTKVKKDDGSFSYLGRIMSLKNGDAYEIVSEDGKYVLEKKGLYDLVSE